MHANPTSLLDKLYNALRGEGQAYLARAAYRQLDVLSRDPTAMFPAAIRPTLVIMHHATWNDLTRELWAGGFMRVESTGHRLEVMGVQVLLDDGVTPGFFRIAVHVEV